jgi:hypothetical protein
MRKRKGRGIPGPLPIPAEQKPLLFSFKHLDLDKEKFNFSKCHIEFLESLLKCLRIFSTWPVETFSDENNNEHRHKIWFNDTTEPDGFLNITNGDPEQFSFHEAWQFGILPDRPENRWRVHGILIDDTFFIVWLDAEHALFHHDN